jgi:RNA polymerase sigma factor (TIGR02999 family)
MVVGPNAGITALLRGWREHEPGAEERLFALIYGELRQLAARNLRAERPGHTLQPTALVNETWLRMASKEAPDFGSRAHFFGVAARLMRQILVDHARARAAQRRQGGLRVGLTEDDTPAADALLAERSLELLELNEALDRFARIDERRAKVLELRHFIGLDRAGIATALGMTERQVKRDLTVAQAWLRRELDRRDP